MGELTAPPHPGIDSDLAELLSPSQVRCFMDCQVRWWFKYGLKYPDPPTGKMVLGRAVHAALAQNFAQKLDSFEDLPIPGVRAIFRESWDIERERTEFRDDEDPSELATCGEALVVKYMDQLAPLIQPAAVEMRVEGRIGGIRVQGWIVRSSTSRPPHEDPAVSMSTTGFKLRHMLSLPQAQVGARESTLS
jgi:PD-(D/E)XK nuclease superfamily